MATGLHKAGGAIYISRGSVYTTSSSPPSRAEPREGLAFRLWLRHAWNSTAATLSQQELRDMIWDKIFHVPIIALGILHYLGSVNGLRPKTRPGLILSLLGACTG